MTNITLTAKWRLQKNFGHNFCGVAHLYVPNLCLGYFKNTMQTWLNDVTICIIMSYACNRSLVNKVYKRFRAEVVELLNIIIFYNLFWRKYTVYLLGCLCSKFALMCAYSFFGSRVLKLKMGDLRTKLSARSYNSYTIRRHFDRFYSHRAASENNVRVGLRRLFQIARNVIVTLTFLLKFYMQYKCRYHVHIIINTLNT